MNLTEEENLIMQLRKYLMINQIKKILYFPIAYYFSFFARIQLAIWKPRIIVITGSSGKTTLLHLAQSQIGDRAEYSRLANSSFGIPFDILRLKRKTLTLEEWPLLFLLAPLNAFQKVHTKNLYVVEADCDRPYEGKFLATLLKPEVTIWLSSTKTHSGNFPQPVEQTIAYEFGYFLENTSRLVIINKDSQLIKKQLPRTKAAIETISLRGSQSYQIFASRTKFKIRGKEYSFKFLLPKEAFYQIEALLKILDYLNIPLDTSFKNFNLPPGRSSLFKGIKNTTILDSSYNADLGSMKVMLKMFDQIPTSKKWVVLGDMIELGQEEEKEHQNLAKLIDQINADNIILIGPRLSKYTFPKLKSTTQKFEGPKEALDYVKNNIKGGEVILFKGARFLEGIIEHLLKNKNDINKLCRREEIWQIRRAQWGL